MKAGFPLKTRTLQITALGFHFVTTAASVCFFEKPVRYCILCSGLFKAKALPKVAQGTGGDKRRSLLIY